jgi:hypothetical protein
MHHRQPEIPLPKHLFFKFLAIMWGIVSLEHFRYIGNEIRMNNEYLRNYAEENRKNNEYVRQLAEKMERRQLS